MRQLVHLATGLALSDCLSVLPPGTVQPEHVAHLTSLHVVAAETKLRDLLTTATQASGQIRRVDVTALAADRRLDDTQTKAAAAIASTDPLVIVEGAAGAGKTTMRRHRRHRRRSGPGSRDPNRDADEEGRRRRRP